jgi:hypothetical protein
MLSYLYHIATIQTSANKTDHKRKGSFCDRYLGYMDMFFELHDHFEVDIVVLHEYEATIETLRTDIGNIPKKNFGIRSVVSSLASPII